MFQICHKARIAYYQQNEEMPKNHYNIFYSIQFTLKLLKI